MAASLAGENVSNNAVDELSSSLSQTVLNFERMKKVRGTSPLTPQCYCP